jgi:hypothetical protein
MVVLSPLRNLIRFAAAFLSNDNMPLRNGRSLRSRYAGSVALPVKFGAGLSCANESPTL